MSDPGVLARTLIQKYFPKFGTIRKQIEYRKMSDTNYTPGNIQVSVLSSHTLDVIWDEFSFTSTMAALLQKDDSAILDVDKKVIFPALDLPVSPALTDRIVDDSGDTWAIMAIAADPADAHFELHVRPIAYV